MIRRILEDDEVGPYLRKRNIFSQYLKAKQLFLKGHEDLIRLKKRQPKTKGIWDFRINHQYRAVGYFEDDETFVVSYIDDHQ